MPRPNPPFADLEAYATPRHPAPVDLYLNANEGPGAPPELLRLAFEAALPSLNRYPKAAALEAALAARLGVSGDRVLVTAGADEALDRAFRVFLGPSRELILPSPTFVMMAHYARLVGCVVRELPWTPERFPTEAVLGAITPATGAIALVTPNNPTGALIPTETLARIADAAPDAAILVDLAYVEFAPSDPTPALIDKPNVLLFRTFSKAWGLAGARVGYVVSTPAIIGALRAAASPFSVPGPSLALALRWFERGQAAVGERVAATLAEREALEAQLRGHGLVVSTSAANFAFADLGSEGRAAWLVDALAGLGIAIRGFPRHPTLASSVRITCPCHPDAFARLQAAIEAALAPRRHVIEELAALDAADGGPTCFYSSRPAAIAAARHRGAVPVGLASEGDTALRDKLHAAGAARVVPTPAALQEGP